VGLFDILKKKDVVDTKKAAPPPGTWRGLSMDDFDMWEDEERVEWIKDKLGPLAEQLGGKFKVRSDDDELDLRVTVNGLPMRARIDYCAGASMEIEAKFENHKGTMVLDWEDPADRSSLDDDDDDDDDDAWAEDDGKKIQLGGGVYIEEFADQAGGWKAVFDGLPTSLRDQLLREMPELRINSVRVDADNIGLTPTTELHEAKDPVMYLTRSFNLMVELLRTFATGTASVKPRVRVMLGGQPIQPE